MPSSCPPENGVGLYDPCTTPGWDDWIGRLPGACFFHGRAWAEVLVRVYGYRPFSLVLPSAGSPRALLSLMEVQSALTGKRGVSLPFADRAPALAPDEASFERLFAEAKALGDRRSWRAIELRGAPLPGETPFSAAFLEHVLPLEREEKDLFRTLDSATRRNVNRARKESLEVRFGAGSEEMRAFFRMHCRTRRDHGLPPQPWRFFEVIRERVIAPGGGIIASAYHGGAPASAAVFFFFRDQVLYKFGASEKSLLRLRPNNLLFWEAIRRFRGEGFRSLHFGRTDRDNEGLARFKRGWGAEESEIRYHRFDLKRGAFDGGRNGPASSYPIFRLLPLPVLRLIGACLYRHFG
ncbi:MAG: GNAT family N-acetyltransferase [Desulfobacterales bacterium]